VTLHRQSDAQSWAILPGDCRKTLPGLASGSVRTCVTSPPYLGLRNYGNDGDIGLEPLDRYVDALVDVFRLVRDALADDGTLWLNLGDSYAAQTGLRTKGSGGPALVGTAQQGRSAVHRPRRPPEGLKPKDLIGVPWRVAFALQEDGWYLRSDIIWAKPNPMPESVTDRPTKAHEYLFLLSKSRSYYYDADAIREAPAESTLADRRAPRSRSYEGDPRGGNQSHAAASAGHPVPTPDNGRNKRSVWTVATQPYGGAHFATFPPKLIEPCILAGAGPGDLVLDPFAGACTTGLVALRHGRSFIGCEANPEYIALGRERIIADSPLLNTHAEAA
jgi:DNA modification methylase